MGHERMEGFFVGGAVFGLSEAVVGLGNAAVQRACLQRHEPLTAEEKVFVKRLFEEAI